jgi:glycosyltransferase involved in cell wall biosynthesis
MNPRILLVAASPRYVGGQSVMAQRLLADLGGDGVTVGFLPVDPTVPRILSPLDRVKYVRTLLRSLFYVSSLIRHVPRHDIIHVFSASYSSFLISPAPALLVSRVFGKPSILNYRSGEASDHLQRSGRVTDRLIRLATCIVVPSGFLVGVFRQFGLSPIEIPNHVDTSLIKYRERRNVRPHILVSRTLEPLYNIECALRAFQIVQDKHPNAELTVLGDGSQREFLAQLATELQLSNVHFSGRVERSDIARYYDEADIFLNTSSIDNMPVSIIEAFAAGLPVVTTNAGGIPYLISDRVNGHLLQVNDHKAVAERLIELVDNPDEACRLSRAGREEVRKYSWDVAGPKWKSLYRSLCQPLANRDPSANAKCQSAVSR